MEGNGAPPAADSKNDLNASGGKNRRKGNQEGFLRLREEKRLVFRRERSVSKTRKDNENTRRDPTFGLAGKAKYKFGCHPGKKRIGKVGDYKREDLKRSSHPIKQDQSATD